MTSLNLFLNLIALGRIKYVYASWNYSLKYAFSQL